MGKSFSKLNVKAQYWNLIMNFKQKLGDDTNKNIFQHGRSSKITTEYVEPKDEGGKSIAVKILEKEQ